MGEAQILRTAENAFASVWRYLKLCVTIGLPSETDGDAFGLARPGQKVPAVGEQHRHTSRLSYHDLPEALESLRARREGGLGARLERVRPWTDRSGALSGPGLQDCRRTPRSGGSPDLGLQHQTGHLPSHGRPG